MSSQWLRRASLVVSDASGNGLDLSGLNFEFQIKAADKESPQAGFFRIFNMKPETMAQIGPSPSSQYSNVTLQCGYYGLNNDGPFGVIFQGTIKQTRRGRQNATDSFLDLVAADGDIFATLAVLNYSLGAGSTSQSRLNAALAASGLTVGYIPDDVAGPTLPRGKAVHCMARRELHIWAATHGLTYSIQSGKIVFLPLLGFRDGEAVVVNAQTGMIGWPEQTEEGIKVRMLINPQLEVGCKLQINNADIQQAQQTNLSPQGEVDYATLQWNVPLNDDGIYRIHVIEHVGNTRANDWYSDVICLSSTQDSNTALTQSGKG